jgi:hypothetical protein
MAASAKWKFESVSLREEWGVADATGFHLHDTDNYEPHWMKRVDPVTHFTVCRIDGRQVAVFAQTPVPAEARAELTSRKPDWLDAVVYASVISDPRAEVAVIDAQVTSSDDADLEACAFATACVAINYGLFEVVPTSYAIRFEGRSTVRVSMDFDWDSESWFGEAAGGY